MVHPPGIGCGSAAEFDEGAVFGEGGLSVRELGGAVVTLWPQEVVDIGTELLAVSEVCELVLG